MKYKLKRDIPHNNENRARTTNNTPQGTNFWSEAYMTRERGKDARNMF
jgi:hypothetical protein